LDDDGTIQLTDFGYSRIRHHERRSLSCARTGGKWRYAAPELANDGEQGWTTEASDIYSLALTYLELATLERPFPDKNDCGVTSMVQRGGRPAKPLKTRLLNEEQTARLWSLLEEMWDHDPTRRPAIAHVECMLKTSMSPSFPRKSLRPG